MGRRIGVIAGVLLAMAAPAPAGEADRAAIAASVRRQLTACWSLPPGFTGRDVEITIAFFGDGKLDGEPQVAPLGGKGAGKLAPLVASAVRAVKRCAPFEGLEALGADPAERFSIAVHFQG
jgi:hypothetical protein